VGPGSTFRYLSLSLSLPVSSSPRGEAVISRKRSRSSNADMYLLVSCIHPRRTFPSISTETSSSSYAAHRRSSFTLRKVSLVPFFFRRRIRSSPSSRYSNSPSIRVRYTRYFVGLKTHIPNQSVLRIPSAESVSISVFSRIQRWIARICYPCCTDKSSNAPGQLRSSIVSTFNILDASAPVSPTHLLARYPSSRSINSGSIRALLLKSEHGVQCANPRLFSAHTRSLDRCIRTLSSG